MANARVISVNRGPEADMLIGGKPSRTGINKQPAAGQIPLSRTGLAGDESSAANHGGRDQALYAYAREDLDWWTEQLARELRNGLFGENLTTAGIDVSAAVIGEVWQVGNVSVQVTAPRIPCVTFKTWMDEPHWVKRFAAARRPGAYLRVLTEGTVGAGDQLVVISRPDTEVTVAESMLAYYGDREIMHRVLEVEGRGWKWDEICSDLLSRA
jgi:MOSC domain-containing protein YiiM